MKTLIATMLALAATAATARAPLPPPAPITPADARQRIAEAQARPDEAAARGIVRYTLGSRTLWLLPSPCCDQFNHVYTEAGEAVCAPTGGIVGRGDGRCPPGLRREDEAPAPR